MSLDAGSVFATLGAKFNPAGFVQFGSAMDRAGAQMAAGEAKIAAGANRSSAALGKLGSVAKTGAAVGVAAVGAALYESVKGAITFEKGMRNVNSIAKLSEGQLKDLSKGVLSLSGKTAQAPKTLAAGMYQLVSSGFDAKDSLTILASTSKAATAGLTDTETATTAVAGALNAYHLKASDAAYVSDQLFQTVNRGVISFPALAQTIGTVLPFAASLHIGLDQVGASISTLTKQGIPAAEATTYLKNAMVQFLKPSDALSVAIKKTGAESGEALVKQKGFQGALEAVAKTTDGTKGALQRMFPDIRASAAVFALTGKNIRMAEADLKGFSKAATAGVTDQVFKEQSKSTAFQFQQLKANLSVLGVEIGTAILPALNDATKAAAKFIGQMNSGTGAGGSFVTKIKGDLVQFLGIVTTVIDGVKLMVQALSFGDKLLGGGGFDKQIDAIQGFSDKINHVREDLSRKPLNMKIGADASQATTALRKVEVIGLRPKVMQILGKDISAAAKVKQIRALGIDAKTARILGENAAALSAIGGVRAAMNSLPNSRTIALNVITTSTNIIKNSVSTALAKAGKKRAAGRGPGGAETALTGEGRGPELVGNMADGFTVVDRATIMDLRPEDSVVPFGDPAQSGRALGLLLDMLGIKGYAKGKAPAKKKASGRLPIPAAVQFGAVPEDELDRSRDDAREAYQKRKDRVHDIDVDIRAQRKKVAGAKKGKARTAAQAKLNDLQRDRHRYNDGGNGYTSLAKMRAQWQELQRQATSLHAYNRDIERLNTLQETDRTRMSTAAKTGNAGAWGAAKTDRDGILKTLRAKYAAALKLAKNPNFKADLESKLAGIDSEIADSAADAFTQDSPFDGGLSKAEQQRLAELQRDQSLAALTAGLGDDQASAGATLSFLEQMLGAAQADPSRGGASAVRDLADQVKQARDNVASFAAGGSASNDNADLSAQLAQRDEQLRVARRESEINAQGLATFQGAGDIGSAGWRPSITINTLHPGDPATLRAIGDAAVGGMSYQASRPSPRTDLGL